MSAPNVDPYLHLCEKVHQAACARGELYYLDPKTGHQVMTEIFLKEQGTCCESQCRHCPCGYTQKSCP